MNEDKLKQILDEMLVTDLKNIPSDEEVKKCHSFTKSFLLSMEQLILQQKRQEKKSKYRYINRTLKVAACLFCFIGIGTLVFTILPNNGMKTGSSIVEDISQTEDSNITEDMEASEDTNDTTDMEASDDMEAAEDMETAQDMETADDISKNKEESNGKESENLDQAKISDGWSLKSIKKKDTSSNMVYQIQLTLENTTDTNMTFTPVYNWKYQMNGKTEEVNLDFDADIETITLAPGEYLDENLMIDQFETKVESGGWLEITRDVNGTSSTLSFIIE